MHPASPPIVTRTPGKINLLLAVGGQYDDGYHKIVNVFQAVDLYEDISVRWAPEWSLHFTGSHSLIVDDDNLVLRAGRLLASRAAQLRTVSSPENLAAACTVRKRVPIAGGMAGGSADAAGALVALARLWRLEVSREQLGEMAAELGADVPFGLVGGTAIGTGRGDRLTAVITREAYHWVLLTQGEGLSTVDVYRRFDELVDDGQIDATGKAQALAEAEAVVTALATGDPEQLGRHLRNDLQAAAISLRPSLQHTLDEARDLGAVAGIVSGSGPTIALLAGDAHHAAALAQSMLARGHQASVVSSPARGAHVL
ncbi:4-(cytidine 5'-diphospho)-2-C-methyl-D-erythritol kinase [Pseudoclavibacter sp. 13-3]|uniref:4-(cytidine 5'-diphospho)-2-C-methyl-D-erythritol kinase n=1 Tax=Pseudoclavibacter sp. 13-3 TaxID=2901228 RepID=UPI001E5D8C97|nr:4-(cytidine 5'-diphospho)-2-C-methyl-D-erythritol kinase [Pseudoclavibacter sp. 13-3]MCD7101857.1 4-(cytidine 5'-diphospho)-2-C-methyl-D-erythritol kinase [Pseudoclavibacter sp. 13-3]